MKGEDIRCYRCGESLAALTLPLSRRDECPSCTVHLHVCRMCRYFDPTVAKQCLEDDAEEVTDKERVNFCEWFKPSADAFDPVRAKKAAKAKSDLAALFGEAGEQQPGDDDQLRDAEDLFR
ncbi:MAG: hypothetical protein WD795_09000 [Woeseia sp.]